MIKQSQMFNSTSWPAPVVIQVVLQFTATTTALLNPGNRWSVCISAALNVVIVVLPTLSSYLPLFLIPRSPCLISSALFPVMKILVISLPSWTRHLPLMKATSAPSYADFLDTGGSVFFPRPFPLIHPFSLFAGVFHSLSVILCRLKKLQISCS